MRRGLDPIRGRLSIPLVLLFALAGCGDDSTPSGPGVPPAQQLQDGTAQLNDFMDGASKTPGALLLDSAEFQNLLGALGTPAASFTLPQPPGASPTVRRVLQKLGAGQHVIAQAEFGTYERDPQNVLGPFLGWKLVDAGNPPDGFVFRFDLNDGITIDDGMGIPIPVRGEFRFINLEIDDAGTPNDPTDDFLTGLVIEIAATAESMGSVPVLVRFELHATFDETGELQTLTLGNPQANDSNDPGAAFIGPALLAVSVAVNTTTAIAQVQVYDSSERFVVSLDLHVVQDPVSGLVQSAGIELGWGVTRQPTSPPWLMAVMLDNFRMVSDFGGEIADVSGRITYRSVLLATLSGDTSEVPVDLDGDEVPDVNCPNVLVTFTDAPNEPQNLCEALPALQDLLGQGGIPKLVPLGGGWR